MCHGSQFLDTIQETSKNVVVIAAAAAVAAAATVVVGDIDVVDVLVLVLLTLLLLQTLMNSERLQDINYSTNDLKTFISNGIFSIKNFQIC